MSPNTFPFALPLSLTLAQATPGWVLRDADHRLIVWCESQIVAEALMLRANAYPELVAAVAAALLQVQEYNRVRLARAWRCDRQMDVIAQCRAALAAAQHPGTEDPCPDS